MKPPWRKYDWKIANAVMEGSTWCLMLVLLSFANNTSFYNLQNWRPWRKKDERIELCISIISICPKHHDRVEITILSQMVEARSLQRARTEFCWLKMLTFCILKLEPKKFTIPLLIFCKQFDVDSHMLVSQYRWGAHEEMGLGVDFLRNFPRYWRYGIGDGILVFESRFIVGQKILQAAFLKIWNDSWICAKTFKY